MPFVIKLFLIALILTGCSVVTTQFNIPIADDNRTQIIEILYKGEPVILRPYNVAESIARGAIGGGYHDCMIWLCIPILATVGSIVGLTSAEAPSTVEHARKALESAEVENQFDDLLIKQIIVTGGELTPHHFVVAGHVDPYQKREDRNPIELTVRAQSIGIKPVAGKYVFSLIIQGQIGSQKTVPIEYKSLEREIDYWISNDGANLQSSMKEAINHVAEALVGMIFSPGTEQNN